MVITLKALISLTPKQSRKIDDLEATIDSHLRKNFDPFKEQYVFQLPTKLLPVERYHLEQKYKKAGWDVITENNGEKRQSFILNYDLD